MHLRKRIPYKGDSYLISLTMDNFKVKSTVVQNILKRSHEVLVIFNSDDKVIGWYVNTKLDSFFKVFHFVLNRTHIIKGSMDTQVIKPMDIVL